MWLQALVQLKTFEESHITCLLLSFFRIALGLFRGLLICQHFSHLSALTLEVLTAGCGRNESCSWIWLTCMLYWQILINVIFYTTWCGITASYSAPPQNHYSQSHDQCQQCIWLHSQWKDLPQPISRPVWYDLCLTDTRIGVIPSQPVAPGLFENEILNFSLSIHSQAWAAFSQIFRLRSMLKSQNGQAWLFLEWIFSPLIPCIAATSYKLSPGERICFSLSLFLSGHIIRPKMPCFSQASSK